MAPKRKRAPSTSARPKRRVCQKTVPLKRPASSSTAIAKRAHANAPVTKLKSTFGFYDALQIGKRADPQIVRRAYLRRALTTHPDKKGGSKQAFEKVVAAYVALINDSSRSDYDARLDSNDSLDGTFWSDHHPGMAVDAPPLGLVSGPAVQDDEVLRNAEEVAMKAWIRSFDEDVDVSCLTMLELTTLLEIWRFQLQVDDGSFVKTWQVEDKAWTGVGHVAYSHIEYHKAQSKYRIQLQMNRLSFRTQYTSKGNLAQAIEWHGAIMKMVATAKSRMAQFANPQEVEPLTENEFLSALCEQPTMRIHFRVHCGRTKQFLWSPTTRSFGLAMSLWRGKIYCAQKDGWSQAKIRLMKSVREATLQHGERCSKVLERISRRIRCGALNSDRQQTSSQTMLENVKALKEVLEEVRYEQRTLKEDNRFLSNRVIELEGRLAITDTPASSTPPEQQVAIRRPRKPRTSPYESAARTPVRNARVAPASSTEKQDQFNPMMVTGKLKQSANRGNVPPWWSGFWPSCVFYFQGRGDELGSRVLACLTLNDLTAMQGVSPSMQAGGEKEMQSRLRVFQYSEDLHGFIRRQSSLHGRALPIKPQYIAKTTSNFLVRFQRYIEELDFTTAPCELLENKSFVSVLSHLRAMRVTFPAGGWSDNMAIKNAVKALRAGVSYKLVDCRGQLMKEGIAH